MNGRTIWITGATSGIGEALAKEAAKTGANLLLSARTESKLQEIVKELNNSYEGSFQYLVLDLADMDSHPNKVREALDMTGGIDVMVHNGGISQRSLAIETSLEVDRRVMEIDYFGTVSLTKALLPNFVQNKKGHFVVVTSLMGKFSSPMRSGYCGAKHALHGFFDALRAEHHDDGLTVTLVCPGFIATNISKNALTSDGSTQGTMDEATGAGLSPAECARQMLKAISKKKAEVYIGRKEIMGVYLKRFFPGILRKVVRKAKVT
ncbi:MAG: SDR family oxidoreductase [Flavobacteriales bacterium]|nr:SDR family oxidoreductase [Flavobacteriales bacterium]